MGRLGCLQAETDCGLDPQSGLGGGKKRMSKTRSQTWDSMGKEELGYLKVG